MLKSDLQGSQSYGPMSVILQSATPGQTATVYILWTKYSLLGLRVENIAWLGWWKMTTVVTRIRTIGIPAFLPNMSFIVYYLLLYSSCILPSHYTAAASLAYYQ